MALAPIPQPPTLRRLILFHQRPVVRLYETLSLILLTTAFFAFVFIRPTLTKIVTLTQEIQTDQQLNQNLQQKADAVNRAKALYANLSPQLPVLDESLPTIPATADFLAKIENLTLTRQLQLRSLSFSPYLLFGSTVVPGMQNPVSPTLSTSIENYPFTIVVTGPYSNLEGFISDLQSLRRIVNLTSLTFSQTLSETGTALTLNITGTIASAKANVPFP